MAKVRFSPDDMKRIEDAVKRAEERASGEIVPVFVEISGHYREALWQATALGALGAVAFLLTYGFFWPSWEVHPERDLLYVLLSAAVAYTVVLKSRFLQKMLVGKVRFAETVRRRADQEFIRREIFRTKERTGILILMSFYERQVVVLADSGIHNKVENGTWDQVIQLILEGIHQNRPADGLIKGINLCADLLVANGFVTKPGDRNELSNRLQEGDS